MTPNFKLTASGSVQVDYEVLKFPSGEVQVNLHQCCKNTRNITIVGSMLSSDHLMELLQLSAILKQPERRVHLIMPYCAYSRQDRHMTSDNTDSFSLKVFTQLINSCNFTSIITWDNHSDVSTALLDNCTNVPVDKLLNLDTRKYDYFVSPDAGTKKSAKGLLCVHDDAGQLILEDRVSPELERSTVNALQTVFYDGNLTFYETSLKDIRARLRNQL